MLVGQSTSQAFELNLNLKYKMKSNPEGENSSMGARKVLRPLAELLMLEMCPLQ